MDTFSLRGLGIALITPFCPDDTIDFSALSGLLERDIAGGADYLVVLGTTGEAATLTASERERVKSFIVEQCAGRIPLVLGVGGNCTASLVEELRSIDMTGFSAVLSVVPFYNKPNQEGLYSHYMHLADASPLPIILYNVPGRTGVNMTAPTTLRLAKAHDNILGIKEASGDLSQVEAILRDKPDSFELVSGDDALAFPFINMGALGVISVIGNAYPEEFAALVHKTLKGDIIGGRAMQRKFDPMYRLLFQDGNPAGIKCLLNSMGLIENVLRLPLTPCSAETAAKIIASRL